MTGPDKTGATRQAALKERRRAAGLVRVEVWVPPSGVPAVRELESRLQLGLGSYPDDGDPLSTCRPLGGGAD